MKLSKLYSNNKFKTVKFKDGLNIVMARVTDPGNLEKDSHNLGKTTLVHLLNFMLLGNIKYADFLERHIIFGNYTFFLEIKLNNNEYITIRRSVHENTKIWFKLHSQPDQDFRSLDDSEWDIQKSTIENAVKQLDDFLNFDVLPNWSYRKTVGYFLRSQSDYADVFQLHKYTSGNHKEWKPFLFEVLGFDAEPVKEKYELEKSVEDLKSRADTIKSEYSVQIDELDKVKALLEVKEVERTDLRTEIDTFNFYEKERAINRDLVERIEKDIANLNSREYQIKYEIDKVNESLSNKAKFSLKDVVQIYEEAKIYFPENLLKDYQKLLDFNKSISSERNKYLRQTLINLETDLKEVRTGLEELNRQRASALGILQNNDSFLKFKEYQKQLATSEAEIMRLSNKLDNIQKLIDLQEQKDHASEEVRSKINEVRKLLNEGSELYREIRMNFTKFVNNITGYTPILNIKLNSEGNPDFVAEFTEGKEDESEITAMAKGNSYLKILCAAFDLSIVTAYTNHSFFRFIYHDGVLEALDNRKKIKFINLVSEIVKNTGIQYIFTLIEDDSLRDEKGVKQEFNDEDIVLTLTDEGPEGKLFEIEF